MRHLLFAATATFALLAGCRQTDDQANAPAANNASTTVEANSVTPAAATVSGEEALRVQKERHEGMEKIGKATKALGREMEASAPDLAVIRSSAATIAELAPKAASWFPAGSGPEVGKTHAKAEIWQKPEDFAAKAETFEQAAAALNTAAQGSDVNAIKASFGELGKSCKACHDPYRAKDKD